MLIVDEDTGKKYMQLTMRKLAYAGQTRKCGAVNHANIIKRNMTIMTMMQDIQERDLLMSV